MYIGSLSYSSQMTIKQLILSWRMTLRSTYLNELANLEGELNLGTFISIITTSFKMVEIYSSSCFCELGDPAKIRCCCSLKRMRLSLNTSRIPFGVSRAEVRKWLFDFSAIFYIIMSFTRDLFSVLFISLM